MTPTWRHGKDPPRPEAVGVLALEVYFPTQHVFMSDMEVADGCPGKYTRGLGQEAMSFCSDREDVVSMALTVTRSLMEKYGVRPEEVGHLQVATESGVDRSKSIKSHLTTLFTTTTFSAKNQQQRQHAQHQNQNTHHHHQQLEQHQPHQQPPISENSTSSTTSSTISGTTSSTTSSSTSSSTSSTTSWRQWRRGVGRGPPAEGVDCVHACYGGTAAVLAAADWVESRRWDGRLALVVAADVALYAPGTPARPTGGCGAAAILVGPDAPLVLDPLWYGSHAEHSWDFYKPLGTLPYPAVDGPQTLVQYLRAAGMCGMLLVNRLERAGELAPGQGLLPQVHHFVAHAPFNKLARKGLARLALMDAIRRGRRGATTDAATAAAVAATAGSELKAAGAGLQTQLHTHSPKASGAGTGAVGIETEGSGKVQQEAEEAEETVEATVERLRSGGGGSYSSACGCAPGGDRQQETGHGTVDHEWVREWVQEQQQQQQQQQQEEGAASQRGPLTLTPANVHPNQCTHEKAKAAAAHPTLHLHSQLKMTSACIRYNTADLAPEGPSQLRSAEAEATAADHTPESAAAAALVDRTSDFAEISATATATEKVAKNSSPPSVLISAKERSGAPGGTGDDISVTDIAAVGVTAAAADLSSYESYATWRLEDKDLEAQLVAGTTSEWREKAEDGSWLQKQVGNSYTACVWQGLASLVWRQGTQLAGRRVLLFSFGSGTIASLFSLVSRGGGCSRGGRQAESIQGAGDGDDSDGPSDLRFTLESIQRVLDLDERLRARVRRPLELFDAVSAQVAASYACPVPYEPRGDVAAVAAGSYYLVRVDEHSRRWYERKV